MRPALPDLLPIHFTRRWFSIQNSQLVYQKKLKVRWVGVLVAGPLPIWTVGWVSQWGSTELRILMDSKPEWSGNREMGMDCGGL